MNKKIILFVIISFFLACDEDNTTHSGIHEGSIKFRTQQEIDDFSKQGYYRINGTVSIGEITLFGDDFIETDISNLEGLRSIEYIQGDLRILGNDNLTDIDGLNNLAHISAFLAIYGTSLKNISGLNSLSSLGGSVEIGNNNSLINIDGLNNLSSMEISFRLENNDSLVNINGLSNLAEIKRVLSISYNEKLTNLEGFNNLSSFGGAKIESNSSLKDFCGIEKALRNGYNGGFIIKNNAYNPSEQEILNGNCSN